MKHDYYSLWLFVCRWPTFSQCDLVWFFTTRQECTRHLRQRHHETVIFQVYACVCNRDMPPPSQPNLQGGKCFMRCQSSALRRTCNLLNRISALNLAESFSVAFKMGMNS